MKLLNIELLYWVSCEDGFKKFELIWELKCSKRLVKVKKEVSNRAVAKGGHGTFIAPELSDCFNKAMMIFKPSEVS